MQSRPPTCSMNGHYKHCVLGAPLVSGPAPVLSALLWFRKGQILAIAYCCPVFIIFLSFPEPITDMLTASNAEHLHFLASCNWVMWCYQKLHFLWRGGHCRRIWRGVVKTYGKKRHVWTHNAFKKELRVGDGCPYLRPHSVRTQGKREAACCLQMTLSQQVQNWKKSWTKVQVRMEETLWQWEAERRGS